MPKVSICIPTYNQINHLKKTIDSVLQQTFTDYEIIITDDSSGAIVKDFVAQYNLHGKLKYYKNAYNLGSPENWNEAIRKASGEYIKLLHHDDWLNYDDSLAKFVLLLDNNPGADFAFSATQAVLPGGNDWVHRISSKQFDILRSNPLLLYYNNLIGAPSNTIFRRNLSMLFDKNLKWLVDIEYYLRQMMNNNNIIYSSELLTVTFLADGSVTNECVNNKQVEVYEYLYVLDKIYSNKSLYTKAALQRCLLKSIAVSNNHNIKSVNDINDCGYYGNIHHSLKSYLAINSFAPALGKLKVLAIRTSQYLLRGENDY
jgi:glycosyltransferase involved in cell wall biosynthesis